MRSTLIAHFLSVQDSTVECRYNVHRISRAYSSCLTRTLCQLISNSPFPLLWPLATSIPLFHSMNLAILDNLMSVDTSYM